MDGVAWFGVLGPLEVTAHGRPVTVAGRSQRELLAVLLLRANRLVEVDFMIDALWPGRPPPSARRQVQNSVGRLRRTLVAGGVPDTPLETRRGGYLLRVLPGELDLLSFARHVEAARGLDRAGRADAAAARLRAALALWRGRPLVELDNAVAVAGARRLAEERTAVLEECLGLELRLGRHHEILGDLTALVEEHPLRERPRALLMTALHRAGRTAEALEEYHRARAAFVTELGLEPGPELRDLEQAILTGALDPPPPAAPPERARPRQLLPDIIDFTGRADLTDRLETLLRTAGTATAVVVAAVAGQAGVGKTALATHVAHRVSEAFPDGQLHVDLGGGGQDRPAEPAEVLARFLRALGAHGQEIPPGLAERAEQYRSAVAGLRMLVVLDNAVDEAQLRPLLPGAPGCAVLITSRSRLAGLPGMVLVELGVLESGQAVDLLARIVGAGRVGAEADAAHELARLCGHLPLALRIAGARLATRPDWPVAELVRRLADERRRLDELTYGDLEVRAGLSFSHGRLGAASQRLFHLLGHLYAPEFALWVCAALLDTTAEEVGPLLDELVEAQLLQPSGTGRARYRLHDLVRLFARGSGGEDPRPAVARALGGWLALTERAHIAVSGGDYATLHSPAPRWTRGLPELPADPLAWYDLERLNLMTAVHQAAAAGLDDLCWDLVASGYTLFLTRGHNDDLEETLRAALVCTRRAGNARGTATMLMGLGLLGTYRHDYVAAAEALEESIRLFREIGERQGLVYAIGVAAHVDGMLGRYDHAVALHEEALEVHRASGDLGAEVLLLRSLGQLLVEIGRLEQAGPHLERALLAGRDGDRRVHAEVLYWLGQLHLAAGEVEPAESAFKEMLAIAEDLVDPREEAEARYGLGLVRLHTGAHGAAAGLFRQALALNRPLGEPLTEGRIRTALGVLHHGNGQPRQAVDHLTEAARIFDAIGIPLWSGRAYRALADAHEALGDGPAADAARRRALALFTEVGAPEAAELARPGGDRPRRDVP
ncbi:BTAD domain-containing putative transcriptional regulator [Nonomuraea sp. NPDC048826]|uniref:AfsR/SARP family transcriptional regulator n=1 Tax=Nonomuraea sp. NPDC048826 TaxID=3364347 RepID=UPI003712FEA5